MLVSGLYLLTNVTLYISMCATTAYVNADLAEWLNTRTQYHHNTTSSCSEQKMALNGKLILF